jgi:hypothetical protein
MLQRPWLGIYKLADLPVWSTIYTIMKTATISVQNQGLCLFAKWIATVTCLALASATKRKYYKTT